jgi:hypothetical protein
MGEAKPLVEFPSLDQPFQGRNNNDCHAPSGLGDQFDSYQGLYCASPWLLSCALHGFKELLKCALSQIVDLAKEAYQLVLSEETIEASLVDG